MKLKVSINKGNVKLMKRAYESRAEKGFATIIALVILRKAIKKAGL